MAHCREILTIQLGTYSNFVGTHWWNLQESCFRYDPTQKSDLCHDVLYREGRTIIGEETFTPRAIFVEPQSRLPPVPTLDDHVNKSNLLWDPDKVEEVDCQQLNKHPYIQDLDEGTDVSEKNYSFETSCRSWSDILKTRLHPRSVFTGFESMNDDLEDRIRGYVEECDNIQGFHLLMSAEDNYSDVLTFLDDEFSSKTRLSIPLLAPNQSERTWPVAAKRLIRTFLTYHNSTSLTTLTVPLSVIDEYNLLEEKSRVFPDLAFNFENNYHTSAILASFLDTFSATYRQSNTRTSLWDVISSFTAYNWKFAASSLALPFSKPPNTTMHQFLEARGEEDPLWTPLSPGVNTDDSWFISQSIRGFADGDVLQQYLQYLYSSTSTVRSLNLPLVTGPPFPKMFSPHVSCKGSVDPTASRADGFEVSSVPALAGLHTCPGVGDMLHSFVNIARKLDLRRLPELSIEQDLMEDAIENMVTCARSHSSLMMVDEL